VRIFLDSADLTEIQHWLGQGVIDGVTTNPTVLLKDKVYDVKTGVRRISALLGTNPVSVEVTTNDLKEMIDQAREFSKWGSNIVVKVPVVNEAGESCLGVMNTLARERIAVNATALLSFNQAMLAAKAGATYVSIFAGRVADEGNDPCILIRNVRKWLDDWSHPAQIIVGSIRTLIDIQNAALSGAQIITIPPQFLPKMVDHKYTRETVRQFNRDAAKALAEIKKAKDAVASGD
jgi:transaldolase